MYTYRTFQGYCSHLQKENEIDVKYVEVSAVGMARKFTINGYNCIADEDDDCPYAQQNHCSVYEKAPITIEE